MEEGFPIVGQFYTIGYVTQLGYNIDTTIAFDIYVKVDCVDIA